MKTTRIALWGAVVVGMAISGAWAQESAVVPAKDGADALAAVQSYIGWHPDKAATIKLYDLVKGRQVVLGLKKLHEEELRLVGSNTYFICGDMAADDGDSYMVWFSVVKGSRSPYRTGPLISYVDQPNAMVVRDVVIHKVNEEDRVTWALNKDGTWTLVPTKATDKAMAQLAAARPKDAPGICPTCGGPVKEAGMAATTNRNLNCPSCRTSIRYVEYWWYYSGAPPFERVHVCDKCAALIDVCPMCSKQ